MLEMASLGAKVLQTRSVEMAMKHNVRLQVRSSFSNESGTFVCSEEEIMEKEVISGIAYSRDEAKLTLVGVKDSPGVSATIFGLLADENIRQALNHATDKAGIIEEILLDRGQVVDSPILPQIYGYQSPSQIYEFNQ